MTLRSYVILGAIVVALVATAVIVRNLNKLIHPRKPRPPIERTLGPFDVLRADTGAALIVAGRRGREERIGLAGVAAPPVGQWAKIAEDHLGAMAGTDVTVVVSRRRILGDTPGTIDPDEPQNDGLDDDNCPGTMEARGPISGTVIGHSGIDLNVAMVAAGYCDAAPDAPKELLAARDKARKAKIGIWSKP